MSKLLFFSAISLASLLGASSYEIVEDLAKTPLLSPVLAERTIGKIILQNGLRAYLVSDPHAEQSAAALVVEAGSWNDPEEYPGTAHFCEHLLFMGSEKYPEENGYGKFVQDNGGSLNAFTASDRTVYTFTVRHNAFSDVLDRFAHFFIDPLFNPSSVGRELKAVDQEFRNHIESDGWRLMMVLKACASKDHPYRLFNCGNAATLGKIPASRVKQWYEEHYTPEKMALVLYSPLPLEELTKLTTSYFDTIPKRSFLKTSLPAEIFSKEQKGGLTSILPIKTTRSYSLVWELPSSLAGFEGKTAAAFLSYLLGSQNKGSLTERFKQNRWIESFSASSFSIGKESLLFSIDLDLTPEGLKHKTEMTKAIFEAIAAIQTNPIPDFLFEEFFALQKLHYQNQSRISPFAFVTDKARALPDEDLRTFPEKSDMGTPFSETTLETLLSSLTAKECLFLVVDPDLATKDSLQKERWTHAAYDLRSMPQKSLTRLEKSSPLAGFKLPESNPFLPRNLQLVSERDQVIKNPTPSLLVDTLGEKFFFAQDHLYHTPNLVFILDLSGEKQEPSPKITALRSLFTECVHEELEELLTKAADAGMSTSLGATGEEKLRFILSGYTEKFPLFAEQFFKALRSSRPTKEIFTQKKLLLIESAENAKEELPLKQATTYLGALLYERNFTPDEMARALAEVTYEELLSFYSELFQEASLEGSLYGNLTSQDARALWKTVSETLQIETPIAPTRSKKILLLAENDGPYILPLSSERQGSGLVVVLQEGPFSMKARAIQQVLSSALKEHFFDTLRTKQQVGYIVQSWDDEDEKQLFQYFAIQSNSHKPSALLERFELFLEEFERDLPNILPPSRFEAIRESFIEKLSIPAENSAGMAALLHMLAFTKDADFAFRQKRIEAFQALTYEEIEKAARELLSKKNTRRIAVTVEGALAPENSFHYQTVSKEELSQAGNFLSSRE